MRYMGTKRHIVENNIDLIREYEKLRKPLIEVSRTLGIKYDTLKKYLKI